MSYETPADREHADITEAASRRPTWALADALERARRDLHNEMVAPVHEGEHRDPVKVAYKVGVTLGRLDAIERDLRDLARNEASAAVAQRRLMDALDVAAEEHAPHTDLPDTPRS